MDGVIVHQSWYYNILYYNIILTKTWKRSGCKQMVSAVSSKYACLACCLRSIKKTVVRRYIPPTCTLQD